MSVSDIWGLWSTKYPGYLENMEHKSPVYLRISEIFRPGPTKHKLYICEHLWPMSRKSQRFLGLWRTNHLYICESQGYSGPESPVYLQISWHLHISWYLQISWYTQISWIFPNLINIQGLKEQESPRYSRISWIFLYHLEILNLLDIGVLWSVNWLNILNL